MNGIGWAGSHTSLYCDPVIGCRAVESELELESRKIQESESTSLTLIFYWLTWLRNLILLPNYLYKICIDKEEHYKLASLAAYLFYSFVVPQV